VSGIEREDLLARGAKVLGAALGGGLVGLAHLDVDVRRRLEQLERALGETTRGRMAGVPLDRLSRGEQRVRVSRLGEHALDEGQLVLHGSRAPRGGPGGVDRPLAGEHAHHADALDRARLIGLAGENRLPRAARLGIAAGHVQLDRGLLQLFDFFGIHYDRHGRVRRHVSQI
jgi:hypothetical protein